MLEIPDSLIVPSRSPVALERLGRWLGVARDLQKLFPDLSRLSMDHGVLDQEGSHLDCDQ